MFDLGAFSTGSNSVQTSGAYSGRSGFWGLRCRHFAYGFSWSFSDGKVHGPRLSERSIAIGVDALNADSAPCRADNTQTCQICRPLAAALPLPSNPARLLTVRCHPAQTESQTPFSQAERRLPSCAPTATCNQCHAITPRTARTFLQLNATAPPTILTSTSSSLTRAKPPSPPHPRPLKPHEIRFFFDAFNVPIP